jgi:glutathione S-transferase
MVWVYLIIVVASFQYIYFIFRTNRARRTGDVLFEKYLHIQMNTMETIITFVPIMFLTQIFLATYPLINNFLIVPLGVLYIIGRSFYSKKYIKDPNYCSLGYSLTMISVISLLTICLGKIIILAYYNFY